jgi:hypothetical protein
VSASVVRGYDTFNNRASQGHALMINSDSSGTLHIRYKTQSHWFNIDEYDFEYIFPITPTQINRFVMPRYGDSYYLYFDSSATPVNICGNIIEVDSFNPTFVYDGQGNVINSSAGAMLVYNVGPVGDVYIDDSSGLATSANQLTIINDISGTNDRLEQVITNTSGAVDKLSQVIINTSGTNDLLEELLAKNETLSSLNLDVFGRLRISEPFTLGDYKHIYGKDTNFFDNVSGGGTITYNNSASCCVLSCSGPGSYAIHQTKLYHQYSPGKSQLILSSARFGTFVPGVNKRTGYFDDYNGIFLEQSGIDGSLNWVIRREVDSSGESYPQSSWNIDRCDGTGDSGFNLDITKAQLITIDFQWLGVGQVRVGFAYGNTYVYAHRFTHSNVLPFVYMRTPNLPVRCEIRNISSGYINASMDQICSTVVSEGGYVESGQDWSYISPTMVNLAANASAVVMGLKLNSTFNSLENNIYIRLLDSAIFSTDTNVKYQVFKILEDVNISGNSWTSVNSNSGAMVNTAIASISGTPEEIDNGWASASQAKGSTPSIGGASGANIGPTAKKNFIVRNPFNGRSEAYAVVITNLNATTATTVGAGIQWREIY